MNQTIYKMAGKQDPFARIPHTMLGDDRISWRAKGILAYLCGKPDGWKMRVGDLVNHAKEGKHAVRVALDELRAAGYAEYVQPRDGGRFLGGCWKISDTPIFSPLTDFRDTEKRDTVNRYHSKKEESKKDCKKNDGLKKTKETPAVAGASLVSEIPEIPAEWKPVKGTKAQQLARIEVPIDYPSEAEFDAFIEDELLDEIGMGKRADLYGDLCRQKWHQWDGRRWRKVRDWQKWIRALNSKMEAATTGGF